MEKIVYNSKLKKILVSMLLVIIIFTSVCPNVTLAVDDGIAYVDGVGTARGSIFEILMSMYNKTDVNSTQKTIGDRRSTDYANEGKLKDDERKLEQTVKSEIDKWINSNFPEINTYIKDNNIQDFSGKSDEEIKNIYLDKIYRDNSKNAEKIEVKFSVSGSSSSYLGGTLGISISATVNLQKSEVETTIQKTDDEIGYLKFEQGHINGSGAAGQDPNGGPTVDADSGEDSADLGGILLSPIFYLINFVADAITSNLGRIMTGNGLSLTSGFKVLQGTPVPPSGEGSEETYHPINTTSFGLSLQYPNIKYTPEEIFAGKIDLLSIDFISGKNYEGNTNTDQDWINIRKVISQWYQVLRMVAIIGLLSVLIYTGIKIIISANAKDKAKYKEWIINWFMAVAILFAMHFIMAFIIAITGELSKLITEVSSVINVNPSTGEPFSTNLMGLVRFMIQSENFAIKVGYEVMYIALIVYTIKFTVVYLKRVLSMAFLTLIAPIVALTYPIDKINDGRAQGFDMWLKEYIFNALLQPMHCILYYVLVGSSVTIAASNPIYGIVVLMFLTEAEKLLKKIFGFDKAGGGTVGGMANAFAAGAVASSISKMMKLPKGNAGSGGSGSNNPQIEGVKPIDKPGMDVFDGDGGNDTGAESNNNNNSDRRDNSENNNSNNNQDSVQQRMLDAYDEKFGTDEYDPAERESMARDLNQSEGRQSDDSGADDEQTREMLREQGWSEEDINDTLGSPASNNVTEQNETNSESRSNSSSNETQNQESSEATNSTPEANQTPIRELAEKVRNSRQFKGAKAVGKRLMKPIYDTDKSLQYNLKRAGKGALRAGAGIALGTATAAVQAGISITDGKYNPAEGIASFTAGYAGAGQIAKGVGSLYDTYQEGTLSDDPDERKEQIMERARKTFGDRDDVIAFNKKNYPGQEKSRMERERDHYLTAGITDLKEMKSGMKYADKLVGKTDGLSAEQIQAKRRDADRQAAATIDFRKRLQDQGQLSSVYDKDKQDKYIQAMVNKAPEADRAKVRRQYENAFKSVIAYDAANA